jgi:uncharacterized protein (DUF2141 family)
MKKQLRTIGLLSGLLFIPAIADNNLFVHIENLRSTNGSLILYVFRSRDGFPTESSKAIFSQTVPASSSHMNVWIKPESLLAFCIIHDENGNGKMDLAMGVFPMEGLACSNNAQAKFGPPDYSDAAFRFEGKPTTMSLQMIYRKEPRNKHRATRDANG